MTKCINWQRQQRKTTSCSMDYNGKDLVSPTWLRFRSQRLRVRNKTHRCTGKEISIAINHDFITKIHLFKYRENFTSKNLKFSDKNTLIFFTFLFKTYIRGTRYNRLGEAVLRSTHKLCFEQKYEK